MKALSFLLVFWLAGWALSAVALVMSSWSRYIRDADYQLQPRKELQQIMALALTWPLAAYIYLLMLFKVVIKFFKV